MILEVIEWDDVVAVYSWGSDQRVPVVGERLTIGETTFQVERVTWHLQEHQQPGTVPAARVTLQVRKARR
jgi:hypothetical protein